jgi:hypothetical protein
MMIAAILLVLLAGTVPYACTNYQDYRRHQRRLQQIEILEQQAACLERQLKAGVSTGAGTQAIIARCDRESQAM